MPASEGGHHTQSLPREPCEHDQPRIGALAVVPKSVSDHARFARVLLWLARIDDALRTAAERALRAVGGEHELARQGRDLGDYLIALEELLADYAV